VELRQGIFAPAEGVDVAAAAEQQPVDAVEERQQQDAVVGGGDEERDAAGLLHAVVVALRQLAARGPHIGGDAYDGARGVVGEVVDDALVFGAEVHMIIHDAVFRRPWGGRRVWVSWETIPCVRARAARRAL